jgi:hypothetical protein
VFTGPFTSAKDLPERTGSVAGMPVSLTSAPPIRKLTKAAPAGAVLADGWILEYPLRSAAGGLIDSTVNAPLFGVE